MKIEVKYINCNTATLCGNLRWGGFHLILREGILLKHGFTHKCLTGQYLH